MRMSAFFLTIGVTAAGLLAATAAEAKCTRLAFSVNDYGKDGPIRDAKQLLDKHIAQWTAERGIKNYRTGKKDVSCELFLDLLVFDEYTCKAEATVCWGEGPGSGNPTIAAPMTAPATMKEPATKPAAAAAKPKATATKAPATTGSVPAPAAAAPTAATAPAQAAPKAAPN